MTDTQAPAYVEELLEIVKNVLYENPEQETRLREAILQHARSQSFRATIEQEIQLLGETIANIENDFSTIESEVHDIDGRKVIRELDGSHQRFLPRWMGLRQEYTSVMLYSQTSAGKINSKIHSFLRHIIPILENESYSIDEKKESLEFYVESLAEFQQQGDGIGTRFLRLSQGVSVFKDDIVKAAKRGQRLNTMELESLHELITRLQKDFDKASGFFNQAWDIVGSTVLRTSTMVSAAGIGAGGASLAKIIGAKTAASTVAVQGGLFGCAGSITTAGGTTCSAGFYTGGGTAIASSGTAASGLAALAPVAAAALLVVGLGALGYSVYGGVTDHSTKMKELSTRLEEKQEEYNRIQRKGADCENVIRELQALDPAFLRLANRLSSMQQIWRLLVVDAQNLSNELTTMQSTQDPVLLSVSTTYIKVLYETLQVALDNYTLQVSRPRT
ncbi:unnamed protein product [Cyclocybe aegerita]|uniref:Uncharacterized protein n=1 Tax=Cyclocybe aegerita TaxID=1973307 RepID=A0A8S0WA70_CYCAE|nr:unnamed protein product [Cyclocybe aegerita]